MANDDGGSPARLASRHRIGVSGAATHESDAALAGEPAPGIGHMHGGGLVPDVHQAQARPERGVKNRHDMVAGEREDAGAARALEGANDDIGAADLSRHGAGGSGSYSLAQLANGWQRLKAALPAPMRTPARWQTTTAARRPGWRATFRYKRPQGAGESAHRQTVVSAPCWQPAHR